jgi:hypothetical protein
MGLMEQRCTCLGHEAFSLLSPTPDTVLVKRTVTLHGGWLGSDTEEGRGKQRNAWGSRIQTSNPGLPNGTSCTKVQSEMVGHPAN